MNTPRTRKALASLALAATLGLAACGSNGSKPSSSTATTAGSSRPGATQSPPKGQVLPVDANPISNTATDPALRIDSVLVENNVDASGKAAADHLEIAVSNAGTTSLGGFEVFYTITDPTSGKKESYYTRLPANFSVAGGAKRTVHFDNTGSVDHFAVNQYSLYYTSTNPLEVTVEVSATGAKVQSVTVNKDAGGAEVPD